MALIAFYAYQASNMQLKTGMHFPPSYGFEHALSLSIGQLTFNYSSTNSGSE